jgi:hypothetical protein
MNRLCGSVGLLVVSLALVGCSGRPGPPPLAKVQGTVTLDGVPMEGGEVRFTSPNQPTKSIPISNGSFSGDVYSGKNRVDVVWDVEGPPNPTDPASKMMVNKVSPEFLGPSSPLNADIQPKGATGLKFEVTSQKR